MLFNSPLFALFFALVYPLYLVLPHRWQNRLLIVASCLFYASWNWKFLFLMLASITTDYWCAKYIDQSNNQNLRRQLLALSIGVNLLILGFFKYANFFIGHPVFNVILPLGISFYTFEAISYTVDVYRRQTKPAQRYADYLLFVIYFPHLIAGPIMRAKDFLPQITTPRPINPGLFYQGAHLFFWGLFEKMFVADNLAKIVDPVFASPGPYKGEDVLTALYAFAFQIFCDFDGYSNMARGLGKCMGFDITINFKLPYLSSNPREFWQRWHISLSTWLRDYVYIPLGGNRRGDIRTYVNLLLTMLLGGLWHGAAWTFVLWGGYHGALLAGHRLMRGERAPPDEPGLYKAVKVLVFFHLVVLGWLLFRATSLAQVVAMLGALFTSLNPTALAAAITPFLLIVSPLFLVQILQARRRDLMALYQLPQFFKIAIYAFLTYLVLSFGVLKPEEFIYFQF